MIERNVLANRAAQAAVIALGLLSAGVMGLELAWPLHATDAGGRAGLETAITLCALLTAQLLGSNFRYTRRIRDLLLLGAVATASFAELVFAAVPAVAGLSTVVPGTSGWFAYAAVVPIAFAAVALAPDGNVRRQSRRRTAIAAAVGVGVVALAGLWDLRLGDSVAQASHRAVTVAATNDPAGLTVTLISIGVLLGAGMVFVHRAGRARTEAWLMVGACLLLAASRLQQLATPLEAATWVTPGDGFRLAAYGLLLTVALRRYARMRGEAAAAALNDERERLARDLHDGLAQDLAFIGAYAQRIEPDLGPGHPLVIAARRALGASRGVIADLAARSASTTEAALGLIADELGARFDVRVRVQIVPGPALAAERELKPVQREELVLIAREAIVNAIMHGGAQRIDVLLDLQGTQPSLLVSDDGSGIKQRSPRSRSGSGLPTMRARAATLGGCLVTRGGARGGTELEVRFGTRAVR